MRKKIARRFLRKNWAKIIRLNQGEEFCPSFKRELESALKL